MLCLKRFKLFQLEGKYEEYKVKFDSGIINDFPANMLRVIIEVSYSICCDNHCLNCSFF